MLTIILIVVVIVLLLAVLRRQERPTGPVLRVYTPAYTPSYTPAEGCEMDGYPTPAETARMRAKAAAEAAKLAAEIEAENVAFFGKAEWAKRKAKAARRLNGPTNG